MASNTFNNPKYNGNGIINNGIQNDLIGNGVPRNQHESPTIQEMKKIPISYIPLNALHEPNFNFGPYNLKQHKGAMTSDYKVPDRFYSSNGGKFQGYDNNNQGRKRKPQQLRKLLKKTKISKPINSDIDALDSNLLNREKPPSYDIELSPLMDRKFGPKASKNSNESMSMHMIPQKTMGTLCGYDEDTKLGKIKYHKGFTGEYVVEHHQMKIMDPQLRLDLPQIIDIHYVINQNNQPSVTFISGFGNDYLKQIGDKSNKQKIDQDIETGEKLIKERDPEPEKELNKKSRRELGKIKHWNGNNGIIQMLNKLVDVNKKDLIMSDGSCLLELGQWVEFALQHSKEGYYIAREVTEPNGRPISNESSKEYNEWNSVPNNYTRHKRGDIKSVSHFHPYQPPCKTYNPRYRGRLY